MRFVPILQPRIWGGRNLAKLGKQLPPREIIGESWEVCDRPEAQSIVANGPLAGKSLDWLWRTCAEFRRQEAKFADHKRFPLLVKWLDCVEPLSVQVHPHATAARRHGGEPKHEAWYVVASSHGAKVWAGLKLGVTKQLFSRALADGSTEKLLRSFTPRPGDLINLPAGCVHAARGILFCEIQQNSDTTYRLHDWGRGRELHIEQGLASMDFNGRHATRRGRRITCPYFQIHQAMFARAWKPPLEFSIVCVVAGRGTIHWRGGTEPYSKGNCWLIPAKLPACRFEPQGKTVAVVGRV